MTATPRSRPRVGWLALAATAGGMLCTAQAQATNTLPELEWVKSEIERLLPGSFDSYPQIYVERMLGAPPDGEHDHWCRVFAPVDVPHLGDNVFYAQVHTGGCSGPVIPGQQVLHFLTIDEENMVVELNGRRIANQAEFEDAHLRPEVWPDLEIDERYGGNCDFRWRLAGDQVRGILMEDGSCTHTSRISGDTYTWKAEWLLGEDALWVFDNGYTEAGDLFVGREDRTHLRLYRTRDFTCSVGDGADERHTLEVHDRGQAEPLPVGPEGAQLRILRGPLPNSRGTAMAEVTRLSLLDADGGVIAETRVTGAPSHVVLDYPGFSARCVSM